MGRDVDIILLDLSLPDSKGLDTFHRVQACAPGMPIIILSDPDEQSLAISAVREGALDYLVRGNINSQLLVRVLRYAFEREQLLSTLERQTKELNSSEKRLRRIIDENAEGIVLVDRKGDVRLVNSAAETILGLKKENIIGKPFHLPLTRDEKTEVAIPLGRSFARTAEIRTVETEWDGESALLVSLHDITDRKLTEKALQEGKELSQSIIETAIDAFVEVDTCGLILKWNQMAEEIFGWSRDEAIGRSLIEVIFPPRHREEHLRSVTNFLSTGEGPFLSPGSELVAVHRDGHEFPVELKTWSIRVGGSYRLNVFIRDISELKKLQALKDEFIRTVSHEIRTPLTTIREGISQVLDGLLGETTKKQENTFAMILEDIDRLTRIINDLLDMSKIDAGMIRLNITEIDLIELIDNIRDAFRHRAEKKGLRIATAFPKKRIRVDADRDMILQVLTNLVGNAVKFTRDGEIRISLKECSGMVECCVSDTGPGISRGDIPKIFDKFKQFGKINASKEKGTGLGLYIVKAIVEQHHGTIWVKSRIDKGSTFHFTLPRHQNESARLEELVMA